MNPDIYILWAWGQEWGNAPRRLLALAIAATMSHDGLSEATIEHLAYLSEIPEASALQAMMGLMLEAKLTRATTDGRAGWAFNEIFGADEIAFPLGRRSVK